MKKSPNYKKLGDYIFEYSKKNRDNFNYPVYSVSNSQGFCRDYFSKDVSGKDKTSYKIVPRGHFAYNPSRINVGSIDWQREEDFVIVSPLYVVFGLHKELSQTYLKYYIKSKPTIELIRLSTSGTVRDTLKYSSLEKFPIPVPPLSEQQQIVSELDKLNLIIDKKKQQVKELDNLAQSIFYDIFGDILEAAPTKCLKDVAEYYIGLTYSPTDVADKGTVVLRSSNIQNNVLDFEDTVRVDMTISDKKIVQDGDILMCARNGSARLVGKVARITNLSERMSFGAFMTIIRSQYNDYLFQFFLSHYFRNQLTTSKTATINQITTKMLDGIKLNVPSMEQQNEFAERMKAIERQKDLINQSIREAQTLFESRMEYYFGE